MAKQPETKVKFSIFNKEFNEGINEMSKENKKLRKEFKLQEEQMKDTATATDKLEHNIKRLGAEQDMVKKKIIAYEDQLKKVKQTYGENSNEANKLSNELLDLRISEQKIENAINRSRSAIEQQSQSMVEGRQDAEKFQQALDGISEKANNAGDSLSTGLSLPLAGIGTIAGMSAMDMDGALRLMVGSLGATGKEAEQLKNDMRAVWNDGFGDNPEEVARSIALIKQNIKGINDGEELQKVTKNMLILAKTTDSDMSEATRGVNQLMHNFGLTAQEAMDLFTKGQQKGLNFSNEMFDNISEYAPLFKDMGFSAGEYFAILENGTKNGAYNLDYINDLMKEFNVRVQDGSEKTSDAFGEMSKETQNLFKEFENGEATTEDLFKAVIPELEKMDDQVKANQIAVELFGTKMEDMGSETVYALDNMNDSFENTEGAMDALAKSQEEAFGIKFKKTLRSVLEAVEPIGEELLEMADEVTPKIEELADWFVNLDDETKEFIATSGLLAAGLGPFLKILGTLTSLTGGLSNGLGGKGLGGTILGLVSKAGPVGIAVGALGGLAIAIGGAVEKQKELNDVSLDAANSMVKEYENTELMIGQFDKLRNQSKLTTDEFSRYVDLQSELKNATGKDAITAIKDEMEKLRKKSGMSNEQLNTMVGLNSDLVEALPGATGKITEQGNQILGATGKAREYNAELQKMATLEMQKEFFEAAENQAKLLEKKVSQQKQLNMIKEHESLVNQVLNNYNQQSVDSALQTLETEREKLRNQINSGELRGAELELAKQQEKVNDDIRLALQGGESELNNQLLTLKQQKTEQDIKLSKTEQEISKLGEIYLKLQLNYLKSAGITDEVARRAVQEGTTLQTIDKQISALETEKKKLNDLYPPNKRNTEEYRNAAGEIDDQIDKLQSAKGKIQGLARDAKDYTDELGSDVTKNVHAVLNPSADAVDNRLKETVWKTISLKYSGGNGHHVPVGYAVGTDFHPGGPAIVGEEGPELIQEGNKWSIHDFGVIPDLKRGAKVYTAEQTEMIRKLPAYASGVGVSDTMARNINITGKNLAARQESIQNRLRVSIEAADVIMDGQSVARIVWKPVKENIDREADTLSRARGDLV
jgi:TP901 family phage tail tape measure protein